MHRRAKIYRKNCGFYQTGAISPNFDEIHIFWSLNTPNAKDSNQKPQGRVDMQVPEFLVPSTYF